MTGPTQSSEQHAGQHAALEGRVAQLEKEVQRLLDMVCELQGRVGGTFDDDACGGRDTASQPKKPPAE